MSGYNFKSFINILLNLVLLISALSCTFTSEVPIEEYYVRNYGQTIENQNDSLISRDGTDDINTDRALLLGGQDSDTSGDNLVEQSNDIDPDVSSDSISDITSDSIIEPIVVPPQAMNTADQAEQALPATYDELAAILPSRTWSSLEEKLFDAVVRSYASRDIALFTASSQKFQSMFPSSQFTPEVSKFISTFYEKSGLLTGSFNGEIFDLGTIDAAMIKDIDSICRILKSYGFGSVLWRPYINSASFEENKKNVFSDYGALYNSNIIPTIEDYLSPLAAATKNNNLKLIVNFPLREHTWLKFTKPKLIDESWFPGGSGINPTSNFVKTGKLNLIHPEARAYLGSVLKELLLQPIDGIVLDKDFTYGMFEGFHELNLLIYEDEKNKDTLKDFSRYNIDPQPRNSLTGNIREKYVNEFARKNQVESLVYKNYILWRNGKIDSQLHRLINIVRSMREDILLGLMATTELIYDKPRAIKDFAIAPEFFLANDADLIVLDSARSAFQNNKLTKEFLVSANYLSANLPKKTQLYLTISSEEQPSLSELNQRIMEVDGLKHDLRAKGIMLKGAKQFILMRQKKKLAQLGR